MQYTASALTALAAVPVKPIALEAQSCRRRIEHPGGASSGEAGGAWEAQGWAGGGVFADGRLRVYLNMSGNCPA